MSSYCTQPSSSKECLLVQKRTTDACVEYCTVGGHSFEKVAGTRFQNPTKKFISAGATLGTAKDVSDLLSHPSTVSIELSFHKRSNYDIN